MEEIVEPRGRTGIFGSLRSAVEAWPQDRKREHGPAEKRAHGQSRAFRAATRSSRLTCRLTASALAAPATKTMSTAIANVAG